MYTTTVKCDIYNICTCSLGHGASGYSHRLQKSIQSMLHSRIFQIYYQASFETTCINIHTCSCQRGSSLVTPLMESNAFWILKKIWKIFWKPSKLVYYCQHIIAPRLVMFKPLYYFPIHSWNSDWNVLYIIIFFNGKPRYKYVVLGHLLNISKNVLKIWEFLID